jgi:hypothetical protein
MNYRDAKAYRKCRTCDNKVLPPRVKCNACRKSKVYTVTVLPAGRKGYNKVGTALHRPDKSHTRKAKRQNSHTLGMQPQELQALNMRRFV